MVPKASFLIGRFESSSTVGTEGQRRPSQPLRTRGFYKLSLKMHSFCLQGVRSEVAGIPLPWSIIHPLQNPFFSRDLISFFNNAEMRYLAM